jgi:hypothetical protein
VHLSGTDKAGQRCIAAAKDEIKDHGGYNFKCHRGPRGEAFCVNTIDMQPDSASPMPTRTAIHRDVFATGASNGTIVYWNRAARKRACDKFVGRPGTPISALRFDPSGLYLAYAHGYDWSRGHAGSTRPETRPEATSLHIHNVAEAEFVVQQ